MRLLSKDNARISFHLGRREKDLLLQLLSLYPVMPPGHQKLSRKSQPDPANQELLEQALAETRSERKQQLEATLGNQARWREHQHGWQLTLEIQEIEPLLQVLNDIRIGSWVLLGSPETPLEEIDETTAPHLWSMEIAGSFQIALLHVLEAPEKNQSP